MLLVAAAVAISIGACGICSGYIDGSLWFPPRPYRLPLVVTAAAISIAPCGFRRSNIYCSLWSPPRYYRWLLVVSAAVLSMAPCGRRRGYIDRCLQSPLWLYGWLVVVCTVIKSSRIHVWADTTVYVECDMCVLLFAGTGASWRMASVEVVVPWQSSV